MQKNGNSRLLFKTANEICGSFTPKLPTVKDKVVNVLEEKERIREWWKEHFEELYNTQNPVDITLLAELPVSNTHEILNDFLLEEVEAALNSRQRNKAPGKDKITAEISQAARETSTEMICSWCNKIYDEECCPTDWDNPVILPIHKKNDKKECTAWVSRNQSNKCSWKGLYKSTSAKATEVRRRNINRRTSRIQSSKSNCGPTACDSTVIGEILWKKSHFIDYRVKRRRNITSPQQQQQQQQSQQ